MAQVGGTHYAKMAIEPFEIGLKNNYDAAAFTIVKYVSHHASKHGAQDLQKAIHCVCIRLDHLMNFGPLPFPAENIAMSDYCEANEIQPEETEILMLLDGWTRSKYVFFAEPFRLQLTLLLESLIETRYGETK